MLFSDCAVQSLAEASSASVDIMTTDHKELIATAIDFRMESDSKSFKVQEKANNDNNQ